ncbi:MAG TPA: peptide chain release factor 2, partial [Candidatus Eisenbacteria bacterium]
VSALEEKMAAPDFWNKPEAARQVIAELKVAKTILADWTSLDAEARTVSELLDLAQAEGDESTLKDLESEGARLSARLEALELRSFLSAPEDSASAIVSIHPGAGGTESQDWASMLLRMFTRWCERNGFETNFLDYQDGDEAGIKDASFEVNGEYAYGYLKGESGVHRLVRISPFDAAKRRHTSFASIFVLPQVEAAADIEVNEGDLRVDTFRASGAGGQHVNKTSSAVRLTHIPSGIVVSCQSERSQHRNRESAMKILKARLYMKRREEEQKKMDKLIDEQKDIAWGSQIRSYVFQPYTMVKDHRTDHQTSDVGKVMDGDLNPFIDAWLRKR